MELSDFIRINLIHVRNMAVIGFAIGFMSGVSFGFLACLSIVLSH